MSNVTPMSLRNYTVPELRAMAKQLTDDPTSKLRKAELIDLVVKASAVAKADTALQEQAANNFLAGAIVSAAAEVEFTPEERRTLNEGKYLGRYHAKRVKFQSRGRVVTGRVADRVHRDVDPRNQGNGKGLLLLAVRHNRDAGHPRVTLHAAEDVELV